MKNTCVFLSALLLLVGVLFLGVGKSSHDIMGVAFLILIIPVNTGSEGRVWLTVISSLTVAALFIFSLLIP